jgi:hypothetical protein
MTSSLTTALPRIAPIVPVIRWQPFNDRNWLRLLPSDYGSLRRMGCYCGSGQGIAKTFKLPFVSHGFCSDCIAAHIPESLRQELRDESWASILGSRIASPDCPPDHGKPIRTNRKT